MGLEEKMLLDKPLGSYGVQAHKTTKVLEINKERGCAQGCPLRPDHTWGRQRSPSYSLSGLTRRWPLLYQRCLQVWQGPLETEVVRPRGRQAMSRDKPHCQ